MAMASHDMLKGKGCCTDTKRSNPCGRFKDSLQADSTLIRKPRAAVTEIVFSLILWHSLLSFFFRGKDPSKVQSWEFIWK